MSDRSAPELLTFKAVQFTLIFSMTSILAYFSKQAVKHWRMNGKDNPDTKLTLVSFIFTGVAYLSFIIYNSL